ncbi:MAG: hypothetical protein LBU30_00455, partial [Candidatus Methanoplasma sp.]|nr:hypothetical protein [Candidatus Methanoplasma sp.]
MAKNYEIVQDAFHRFRDSAAPFAATVLAGYYGEDWWEDGIAKSKIPENQKREMSSDSIRAFADSLDVQRCLTVYSYQWKAFTDADRRFDKKLYGYVSILLGHRNEISHIKTNDIASDDAEEALRMLHLLCEPIDADCAKELKATYGAFRKAGREQEDAAAGDEAAREAPRIEDAAVSTRGTDIHVRKAIAETAQSADTELNAKLRENFDGKIVRKDLTNKIRQGANVPTYVLEYLLGQYCTSQDGEAVAEGV